MSKQQVERYSPPNFHSTFVLASTNEETKLVREEVNLIQGELWNEAMVE
jgi:hypothetical protein